ncbi:DMT family transporter [Brachybacterium muris]|uniref:EamA family transporter n=1 Tax=Brachybacterium muris TaxID=219301 RepID=UPI00223B0725|nr:DMT family transporter [Brachybacterium muris]MCT2177403.1 DMT family transporter [Brachybacterium muris]
MTSSLSRASAPINGAGGAAAVGSGPSGAPGIPAHRPGAMPVLMILASCMCLQFGAALAVQLFPAIGAWGTTSLRLGIAAVVLLAITRPKLHRFTGRQWVAVAVFGVVIGAMNGTFYASIERIPLGTAVAIEFLGPLTVAAVLSTRRSDLLWVLLALGGVSLFGLESLTGADHLDLIGVLLALVAAVFWGLYVLSSARVGQLVPGQDGLAVAMAIGALTVLPLGAPGAVAGLMDLRLLALAAGTAVLASVLPYTLELSALRRLPRNVFGILLSLEPAIALMAGVVLLGQGLSVLKVAAAALVMLASIGVTLTARAPRPDSATVLSDPEVAPVSAPATASYAGTGAGASEDQAWEPPPLTDQIPVISHATVTGEIQALTEAELDQEQPPSR